METGFLNRTVDEAGGPRAYQVYVPPGYDGVRAWPVILFLHGSGERGNDGLLQTEIGLSSAVRKHVERYPALVVMPQVPPDSTWQGRSAQTALRALDRTTAEFNTDPARTYLAGMSMGGNGSWALAYRQSGRFAALVVVCGFVSRLHDFPAVVEGDPATIPQRVAERIAPLPVWMVHGDADPVVPVEESRRMDAALRAAGGEVHYTELPGVGHNCWDAAFNDPALPSWLFAQVMR